MKFLVSLFMLSMSMPAMAYLDPGTGSMIISAIVGLFATCALAIKTYWYKLLRLFKGKPVEQEAEVNNQDAPPSQHEEP